MKFSRFLENKNQIISFDFDGVLHVSLHQGTTHPVDYFNWQEWQPYYKMHKVLKRESLSNTIVIVTARCENMEEPMWDFIQYYELPVQKIYTTCDGPKWPTLEKIGAIKHYDDSPKIARELNGKPIEFIFVKHPSLREF